MRQLQPRIDASTEQLQGSLDSALAATLRSQSPVALGVCLHAYAAIARPQVGGWEVAERVGWLLQTLQACVPRSTAIHAMCIPVHVAGYQS